MNIGGLLIFDVAEADRPHFVDRLRAVLEGRVPRTVLAQRLVHAPDDYDAPAWFGIDRATAIAQIATPSFPTGLDRQGLLDHVVRRGMEPIDLATAGFAIDILGPVEGWGCALYMKVHHCLMDGIGFQSIVEQLSDEGAIEGEARDAPEPAPEREDWLAMAAKKFESEAAARDAEAARKAEALEEFAAFMADPANQRAPMPIPAFGADNSSRRAYRPVSIPLERFKALGRGLGASVNDVFMTVSASALRNYLGPRGQLPEQPLIGQCVRSFRQKEHGAYGNCVVTMFPEIATDEPDPRARIERIRANMAVEKARSAIEERLVDTLDRPYGARERLAACADLEGKKATIGASNVVLSNVPGPAHRLTFAGFPLAGNYPLPIVGPGLFLNITLRRNAENLDLGIMADADKMAELEDFEACIEEAFRELERA